MNDTLPLILEPDRLEPLLGNDDLLLVDLCQPQNWQQAHLPGAVHVNPAELILGTPPAPGKLPPVEQLRALFSRIGYRPDRHIVAYDDEGGGWAGRFLWTLDVIGHRHYSYLNGGLFAWYREGHPLTAEIETVEPTEVSLTLQREYVASLEQVRASLHDPDVKIWDARSAEEYNGLKSGSMRAGHIPGAFNLDWLDVMDRADNLRLLPPQALQMKLHALGVREGQHLITHCQTHHRSGLTYLVARSLGYSVQAYDGSWGEWGNLPDTPIEALA